MSNFGKSFVHTGVIPKFSVKYFSQFQNSFLLCVSQLTISINTFRTCRCCCQRAATVNRCMTDHTLICVFSIHSFPKAFWIISIVLAKAFSSLKQNMMQIYIADLFVILNNEKFRKTQTIFGKQIHAARQAKCPSGNCVIQGVREVLSDILVLRKLRSNVLDGRYEDRLNTFGIDFVYNKKF